VPISQRLYSARETRRLDPSGEVVLCFYDKANDDLYFALKNCIKELVRIGDCLAPRDAQAAVREGELAARALWWRRRAA